MGCEDNPVVISGIGGKFPESNNVLQLQEKLFTKEDFVTNEVRWTTDTVGVGKMRDIDTFDASPFKMHSKLVRASDPTTTQTLERAFEAIIDAGMNPFAMSGRNIAVISASMVSDSENTRAGTSYETSGFTIMGHNRSMVANRISYTFNFTGPSYSIHTSWAGGMRALEQGAQLISQGFAEAAVVTTASLIFYKATGVEYQDMNLSTPGGRCQSFDAQANGTCRSEGVVSFFLQRARDAKRNYARLVSVQSDCLGLRTCSLIHMDSLLTTNLRNFYEKNDINTDDIAYLEADGSGIKSFDTIELNALSSVFFGKRKKPLLIGSVKSNVGNTEASSAFLGITKTIIAFETGFIPPNIHYTSPNPEVPALVNGQFQPVTEATELKGDLAAINTLSIGGTTGHVVIQRNSKEKQALAMGQMPPDGLHRLIMVSARHEDGATANAKRLQSMPVDVEYTALVNDVFKTNLPGYLWKSYVVVPSDEVKYNIKNYDNVKQPLWYCFSGMGSQWTGMGRDLLRIPVFAAAVDKCDAVLQPRGVDIRHILTTDDATTFDNILNCFVGIATVQIGLVDILRTIGLEPDGMIGHSVGELGCAYADGCFTAEEMVLAAYARGKASLDSEVIQGMMAAVGLGYNDMRDRVPPSIDIACHNSSDSCTLSGPTEDVVNYVKSLKEQNIFAKAVSAGNIAYHSRYIQAIAPKLLQHLSELIKEPKPRSSRWVSSSVPEAEWGDATAQLSSAEYHTNNLLSPVLFEEACRHLPNNAIVVEIAPHGLLQAILRRSLIGCVNIPLTSRLADNGVKHLLEAIGNLYLNNVSLDVNALYPTIEYPVSRGTPYLAPLITWEHHENWFHEFENILQLMSRSKDLEVQVDEAAEDYNLWSDHCVEDQIVLSLSQNLIYVWKLLCSSKTLDLEKEPIEIENVVMSQQVILQPVSQLLGVTIRRGSNCFEVCYKEQEEEWKSVLTGILRHNPKPSPSGDPLPEEGKEEEHEEEQKKKEEEEDEVEGEVSGAEVFSLLSHFGYRLGSQFRAVKYLLRRKKGLTAKVQWTGNMVTFLDAIFKLVLFVEMEKEQRFLYTSAFRTLSIDSSTFFELENGTEIEVQYDSRSNILSCKGLQLIGLTFSSDLEVFKKSPALQWKTKGFVAFNSEKLKLEEFLSMTLQLVVEEGLNSWRNKSSQISVINIRGPNEAELSFTKSMREVSKSLPHISITYQEVELSQAREKVVFMPGESYLVSGSYSTLKQFGGSVANGVFLLAHVPTPEATRNGLSPVLTHHLKSGGQLVLLKKRSEVSQLRVLELEKEQWSTDLSHLFNGSDNGQPVVVVCRKWRPNEILPALAKQKFAHRLRCVFLDKSAPRFNLSLPLYHGQLSLGLSVNLLSRGVWGTDCILPVDPHSLNISDNIQGIMTSSDQNLDVNVVSLNTTSLTYQPDTLEQSHGAPDREGEMEFVEYCGTRVGGERVVGLAKHSALTNTVTPDPTLSWPVPPQWSMEEAATLPAPLSLAYYCLHVKGKLKAGERVLIQIGTCPVSQAFIAVALQAGADVYVTIPAKEHLPPLLRAFPQLKPDQVLTLEHFDTVINLKTGSLGMHLVVNCLPDSDTKLSINCLGDDSRFFHLSRIDLRDRQIFGMSVFLKNANFFGVSLTNIMNADIETKTKLHVYLKEAMKKGIVKPFRKRLFTLQNFANAVNNVKSRNWQEKTVVVIKPEGRSELPPTSLQGLHCQSDKTYIILGSGEGLWLNVAEWLVQRGARKLFIAPSRDSISSSFSKQLDRLVALCNVRVVLTSAARLNSQAQAVDFLREAESLGSVAGIFCIAMEEKSPQVAHLDSATRQMKLNLQHFVCLLGGSTAVCESRARHELRSCLVRAEAPLSRPKAVLPYLSSLLACDSSSLTLMVSEEILTSNQDNLRGIYQDPRSYLPSSAAELFMLGEQVHTRPLLHEEVTRSPAHAAVKYSLLPVFVLPGTHTAQLKTLVKQLLHPAYCASLSLLVLSVEEAADALLQEVLKVQPKGPYSVVGETWSGAVALELSTLLEARGHQVELFLLDAAPFSVQQSAVLLQNKNMASLEINLLATLLNLDSTAVKQFSEIKSWKEQSQAALSLVKSSLEVPNEEAQFVNETVLKALTALRCHLSALLAYKPPAQLFKGGVHLLRPKGSSEFDLCGLQRYCQQRPNVYVMEEEDHQQMVNSPACAKVINENLLFTWDY